MTPLLTIQQVADILQVPVKTIYDWRGRNYGPPAIKVGKYLRWKPEAVEEWIENQRE